jgi:membrane fusion protein (multidrug efflux system)
VAEATLSPERAGVRVKPILIGVAAIALVSLASWWVLGLRGRESTDDAFVEGHFVFLSPRVGGHVVEVLVDENQHVSAGQALVRLDRADFEARAAHARADLDAARDRMRQAGAAAEAAAAQGRAAAVRLRHAEQDLSRVRELVGRRAAANTQLDAAVAARDAAAAELRAAEQREAVEAGANVAAGQSLFALAADSGNWVIANFKETQIGRMRAGDRAEIRVDAFPERVFKGHVESISPATGAKYALLPPDNATGNFTKVVQRVPVKIALDGAADEPQLPVGLSVVVSVRVD